LIVGSAPDIVIDWVKTPGWRHRAIESPRYGTIDWPCPGLSLDGRSGHHFPVGWLIAAGEGIAAGTTFERAHSHDLHATVHAMMNIERPAECRGNVIQGLA